MPSPQPPVSSDAPRQSPSSSSTSQPRRPLQPRQPLQPPPTASSSRSVPTRTPSGRVVYSSSPNQPVAPNPRSKSIVDSFRSLSPNQRILVGLAIGACGFAGLYFDRLVPPAAEGSKEEQVAHVAIRVVDKPR